MKEPYPGQRNLVPLVIAVILVMVVLVGGVLFTFLYLLPTLHQQQGTTSSTPTPTPLSKPQIYFGVNVHGLDVPDLPGLTTFEAQAQKKAAIVMWFQAWGDPAKQDFDAPLMTAVREHGSIPMVTWEPWVTGQGPNQPAYSLTNIINGHFDTYITQFAEAAKAWGHPFFLRFAHESNGNWYPWAGTVNGNRPHQYVLAWRHVHDIFTSVGATNVTWVWAVNAGGDLSAFKRLYPGDNYVDWIGMDGYNTGGKAWKSFAGVFKKTYQTLLTFTQKPFMIAETASAPVGGNKAAWINNAFTSTLPDQLTQVKAVIWFDEDKENDWRINSSPLVLHTFASSVLSLIYAQNQYADLNVSPIPIPQDVP
jgi:hypothetical protein